MAINAVFISGVVKSPALRYGADGKPEFRFTLTQSEGQWSLYLPCCAVGTTAERLASELEDGQHILITSAKLCYRKRTTKAGEQSRMEIIVWQVDRLSESTQDERSDVPEGDSASAGERVAPGGAGN